MQTVSILSGQDFPKDLRWDSDFKVIFILRGTLTIQVASSEIHLYEHNITFIKPYELYGGCHFENVCDAYVLRIEPDLWNRLCPDIDKLNFSLRIIKSTDKYSAYKKICKALSQILYYNNISEPSSPAHKYRAISDIIASLIEEFAANTAAHAQTEQENNRIRQIMNYIKDNYDRKISLEMIAGEIGFHPQYFSAYFKKNFGSNFTDYLNSYRINKSLSLLTETDDSIMNIAVACGFNNHKTFGNAFEKITGESPRSFRKKAALISESASEIPQSDMYNYLRSFWRKQETDQSADETTQLTCNIIVNKGRASSINSSHNIISVGRAISCLRSDMQEQLKTAKNELNLEFVRIRDIFSDDLFVYYEDKDKKPSYSWRNLDHIFDFLNTQGLKPFIEIGYMPEQLAAKKQYAGWQYHPNVSAPKSMKQWETLVENFITHLLTRYGRNVVNTWLFDHWTSPNLQMKEGYWNESMEQYFLFYEATFKAVKKVCPEIKMGTPNFSYPSGINWYNEFFSFARSHNIIPDFFSIHLYGCGDGLEENNEFARFQSFYNEYKLPNIKPERTMFQKSFEQIKTLLRENSRPAMPIVVDDWNVTFFPTDYTRDTCFMAPYIIENYFNSYYHVYGMGFASLSDIHEDFFNSDRLFGGGPGLLTYNGIAKASYHALKLVYNFSKNICMRGRNFIVGKTDNGYEILVYNTDFYSDDYISNASSAISFSKRYNVFETVPDLGCHIEVPVRSRKCNIVKTVINRKNGSSYDTWISMGAPGNMTPYMSSYLAQTSVPFMSFNTVNVSGQLIINEIVEPHGVLHILISELPD